MDGKRYPRIASLFFKNKDFRSFREENCPGNVTFKDTLSVAPSNVSLNDFYKIKIILFVANNLWDYVRNN